MMRIASTILSLLTLAVLIMVGTETARAYEPDEVRAILGVRPRSLGPSVEGIVLASQRTFSVQSNGSSEMREHRLLLVGPAARERAIEMRWSFRPGLDGLRLLVGRVHHANGKIDELPADTSRVHAHRAAGPDGYPGISDWVVRAAPVVPGDVLEVKMACVSRRLDDATEICGEYCFADADSVIESELNLVFPSSQTMLAWGFGGLPNASRSMVDNNLSFRWLVGHLPPLRPVARTAASAIGGVLPDSLSPPTLFFAFQTEWAAVVEARTRFWRRGLQQTPPELMEQMRRILDSTGSPEERRDAAVTWLRERLRTLELPAARDWYEPEEPVAILERQDAIPRDRAMILVWLLRHVGIAADAVTVRSRPGASTEVPMPQQFDLWLVRTRIGSSDPVWIDLRDEADTPRSVPAGPGVVWTAEDPDPPLAEFPGFQR
jgi:hypothetical protein